MATISAALSAVKNASCQDVEKIVEVLESESVGFACSTETVQGPFEYLDLTALRGMGLNEKQLIIVKIAQGRLLSNLLITCNTTLIFFMHIHCYAPS